MSGSGGVYSGPSGVGEGSVTGRQEKWRGLEQTCQESGDPEAAVQGRSVLEQTVQEWRVLEDAVQRRRV